MKVEENTKINDNGSYAKTTITTVTPEDGFVTDVIDVNHEHNNKASIFAGKAKNFSFVTDNPKVTRPVTICISIIVEIIGIALVVYGFKKPNYVAILFGGWTIFIITVFFINTQRGINEIEKKYEKNKNQNQQ